MKTRSCSSKFDIYLKGEKINDLNEITNLSEGELTLIEKNFITSSYWKLKLILLGIIFLSGAVIKKKKELRIIKIKYNKIDIKKFKILTKIKNLQDIKVLGVDSFEILESKEEYTDLYNENMKLRNKYLFISVLTSTVVAAIIIIILLSKYGWPH